jgi:hypothetical protein
MTVRGFLRRVLPMMNRGGISAARLQQQRLYGVRNEITLPRSDQESAAGSSTGERVAMLLRRLTSLHR